MSYVCRTKKMHAIIAAEKRNMEFLKLKESVYNAAKDGHGILLAALLNEANDPTVLEYLINQTHNENYGQVFTPLAIAAAYGRFQVVNILLENFKADLEKECVLYADGHLQHGVTALFCAASAGHLNIVELLVEHGANVNHQSRTKSTALRAATYEGRLDIVEYLISRGADVESRNVFGNTCLMIAAHKGHLEIVEYLLKCSANPNHRASCGLTPLHYAAEFNHLDVCEVLLNHGATITSRNKYGQTAALSAAERTNERVIDIFIRRGNLLTKEHLIDVYELMGASFANDRDNYNITKAFTYLMKGMQLRYEDPDNVIKKNLGPPEPAYGSWRECQTIQDLEAIRLNHNSIYMESLAIRERLLGRDFPELTSHIIYRGAIYADHDRYDKCECLWLYAIHLKQRVQRIPIERDVLRFSQLFSQMIQRRAPIRLCSVAAVISYLGAELSSMQVNFKNIVTRNYCDIDVPFLDEFEQNVMTIVYLLDIVTKAMKLNTTLYKKVDLMKISKLITGVNRLNLRLRDGESLLHLAVNGLVPVDDFHINEVCSLPSLELVKILLKYGANPNVVDCDRNTPLHTLVSSLTTPNEADIFTVIDQLIKRLLAAGVHIDSVNKDGLRACQMTSSPSMKTLLVQHEAKEMSLKCLAARCIAQHKIPFKGLIPKQLEPFVQMHCSEKVLDNKNS